MAIARSSLLWLGRRPELDAPGRVTQNLCSVQFVKVQPMQTLLFNAGDTIVAEGQPGEPPVGGAIV